MKSFKIGRFVIPAWIIAILLASCFSGVLGYYLWRTLNIPVEVKEPIEILSYPTSFSLYAGETSFFNVTVENKASLNYTVLLDFILSNTTYQTNYVTFSDAIYTVVSGQQNLTAWLTVEPDAPPINASLAISFERTGAFSFFDDFNSPTLNSKWTIVDPYGGSVFNLTSMTGYLTISTTSPPDRDLWQPVNLHSPRIIQPVDGSFTVETKLWGIFNASIQSAGIVAWKDESNYLRLERAYRYGYQEIIFIGMINGTWGAVGPETISPGALLHVSNINPTYLRLSRAGMTFSGYYSTDGSNWNFLASITLETDYLLSVGLYNVNRGPSEFQSTAFAASFDYFRLTPPILTDLFGPTN